MFFRVNLPRKQGGLGEMNIPLLADKNCKIARDYGVLKVCYSNMEVSGVMLTWSSVFSRDLHVRVFILFF